MPLSSRNTKSETSSLCPPAELEEDMELDDQKTDGGMSRHEEVESEDEDDQDDSRPIVHSQSCLASRISR